MSPENEHVMDEKTEMTSNEPIAEMRFDKKLIIIG